MEENCLVEVLESINHRNPELVAHACCVLRGSWCWGWFQCSQPYIVECAHTVRKCHLRLELHWCQKLIAPPMACPRFQQKVWGQGATALTPPPPWLVFLPTEWFQQRCMSLRCALFLAVGSLVLAAFLSSPSSSPPPPEPFRDRPPVERELTAASEPFTDRPPVERELAAAANSGSRANAHTQSRQVCCLRPLHCRSKTINFSPLAQIRSCPSRATT